MATQPLPAEAAAAGPSGPARRMLAGFAAVLIGGLAVLALSHAAACLNKGGTFSRALDLESRWAALPTCTPFAGRDRDCQTEPPLP